MTPPVGRALGFVTLAALAACRHADVPPPPLPRAAYAHYLAGKLALYGGDSAAAADELGAAAIAAPDQPMIAVEQARALAKAKRDADALAVLTAARKRWPKHSEVWLASGEVLEHGHPDDAVLAYRRAIELARDDERAYLGLVRVQLARGDAHGGEATLHELVARIPTSVEGRYLLARRFLERGDRGDAVAELRRVLERDPDQIDARLELARALRVDGKLADAITQTRSAFDRAGEPMDVAEELFWLLCEADDLQGAVDLLTLLDDDRSDVDALLVVARLELGLGRFAPAAGIAKKLAPMDADAAALVTIQLDFARRDFTAFDAHVAAVPATSTHAAAAQRIAVEAALYRGDNDRAVALAQAIPGVREPELVLVRARARAAAGDPVGALALIEPLSRAHPNDVAALNLAGYLLADSRTRLTDAQHYLETARVLAPGDPAVLDSWGWLLYAQGRAQDALAMLTRATRLAPLEPEILVHLATAQLGARAPAAAVTSTLDHASTLHPSADVQRKIAVVRGKLGA